jgi:hypothetical protein
MVTKQLHAAGTGRERRQPLAHPFPYARRRTPGRFVLDPLEPESKAAEYHRRITAAPLGEERDGFHPGLTVEYEDEMEPTAAALDRICRYVYGELPWEAFQELLTDSPFLEGLLGKTEYLDLLSFHQGAGSETSFRAEVRDLFERRFPGQLLKIRARHVCEQMLSGSTNLLVGLRELNALRHQPGGEVIPLSFVGLASETDSLPAPSQYDRWDARALEARLSELGRYKPAILDAARAFLAQAD